MKNISIFFRQQLFEALKQLEQERIRLLSVYKKIRTAFIIITIPFIIIDAHNGTFKWDDTLNLNQEKDPITSYVVAIALIVLALYKYKWYTVLDKKYYPVIIPKIIEFIHPGLRFEADIPDFERVEGIIESSYNRFCKKVRGFVSLDSDLTINHHVSGEIGHTRLAFAMIEMKRRSLFKKGFKGLFITADFNKELHHETYVHPCSWEKRAGVEFILRSPAWRSHGQRVRLENPEFENEFDVFSGDQVEARYILSTSLMARILDYRKKIKKPLVLVFDKSKMYAAISHKGLKLLKAPGISQSILSFKRCKDIFEDFLLAINIVEDLDLNTRIWIYNKDDHKKKSRSIETKSALNPREQVLAVMTVLILQDGCVDKAEDKMFVWIANKAGISRDRAKEIYISTKEGTYVPKQPETREEKKAILDDAIELCLDNDKIATQDEMMLYTIGNKLGFDNFQVQKIISSRK